MVAIQVMREAEKSGDIIDMKTFDVLLEEHEKHGIARMPARAPAAWPTSGGPAAGPIKIYNKNPALAVGVALQHPLFSTNRAAPRWTPLLML